MNNYLDCDLISAISTHITIKKGLIFSFSFGQYGG